MFVTSLILGLIGVLCILDSRLLGRLNLERPLITATLVGLVLGDLPAGLAMGATLELISLGIVNIGAAAPPDMNMAAIISTAFAILTGASAETALTIAIPIAVLGQMIGVLMRTVLANLTHAADRAIEAGNFGRARSMHIVWGTLLYALMYFVPIFLAVFVGTDFVQKLVADRWPEPGSQIPHRLRYRPSAFHHAQQGSDRILPVRLFHGRLSGA